ncbi:MAG: hypothetical protein QOE70_1870 [Chthoniobacter sp.]|nr:hypothetical protein [Chthoniobacter sp.]
MIATLLTDPKEASAYAELMRPEPLAGGVEPEERLILCGLGWQRYLALDKALGDDRPGPRFYYLDGDLEIMITSNEHERIKKWIADLMTVYFEQAGTEIIPRGQATMRQALKEAGAEPNESWCIGEEKEFPDIVLEIALTSGGLSKLEIYRRFAVPEMWLWRRGALEVFVLRADASAYDRVPDSRMLPDLPVELLQRCVAIPSWQGARRAFRAGFAQGRSLRLPPGRLWGRVGQALVTVHDPLDSVRVDIDEQAVDGDAWADEHALADKFHAAADVLAFTREHAEEFHEVVRQPLARDAEGAESVGQFGDAGLAHAAIGVADDGDLPPAFHRAGQGQRAHRAARAAGDHISGVAQPDELLIRQTEGGWKDGVQTRIDAGEGDDRELESEFRRVEWGGALRGRRSLIPRQDRFEEAHGWIVRGHGTDFHWRAFSSSQEGRQLGIRGMRTFRRDRGGFPHRRSPEGCSGASTGYNWCESCPH